MDIVAQLQAEIQGAIRELLALEVPSETIQVTPTRSEFEGDYTVVVFPWVKQARCKPEELGHRLGDYLLQHSPSVADVNVVKGFLNMSLRDEFLTLALARMPKDGTFGLAAPNSSGRTLCLEYSSPNTNKPLHLGHIRNILLGWSVSRIKEAVGDRVVMVNVTNDRGIHICKSMLAWMRHGQGETPQSSGMKGDFLVGKYYVLFEKDFRREVAELVAGGMTEEEAKEAAPSMREAQEMLRRWERKDPEIYALWERMNSWVYAGFEVTYQTLGVHFDKIYYESDTYILGKSLVEDGLACGVFYRREDGSVWADLTDIGLDEKLLLRSDGTSVYMTQDLGTALERYNEFRFDDMTYVVGDEQNYHFQVLQILLQRLGYEWASRIFHLSYGMVALPEGKMKSREGTVVDADDLIASVVSIARETSDTLGKLKEVDPADLDDIHRAVGLGALKYFIIKVDPTKSMVFDPKESIDFNGNTGPFIQYTHARACSILRRMEGQVEPLLPTLEGISYSPFERKLIRRLYAFPGLIRQAAKEHSPALVANYTYELAREFNQFYHECPVSREEDPKLRSMRVELTRGVVKVLASALRLLGIQAPERM
ncbi:MAG: arginine--tRNA ligase [Bacteroidia bacterium]|nr:MAG: arginine--tRNA ligase [Bacteroidia bacterium]